MDLRIRDATAADKAAITAFTRDTFGWGDYVANAFHRWLADPDGKLVVAVDDGDTPVAMGYGSLLSATELWLQGARVHPDWRRRGLASAIDAAIEDWARHRGAEVSRLAIEDWNTPALRQVERIGMRPVSTWLVAGRRITLAGPAPTSNGGRRPPPRDRLVRAPSAESAPAYMAWSSSELGKAGRGMLSIGWSWRRLTLEDLVEAARNAALWMSPAGWVMAGVDGDTLDIGWLETGPDEAAELCKATLDLAAEVDAETIELRVPEVPWLAAPLDALGFSTARVVVFAKGL